MWKSWTHVVVVVSQINYVGMSLFPEDTRLSKQFWNLYNGIIHCINVPDLLQLAWVLHIWASTSLSQPQRWHCRWCGKLELVDSTGLVGKALQAGMMMTNLPVVSHMNPPHRCKRFFPGLADRKTESLLWSYAAVHRDLCPAKVERPDVCGGSTKACVFKWKEIPKKIQLVFADHI